MKKLIAIALVLVLCLSLIPAAFAADDLIKVGIVNNPPSESGYREANVNDFISVFTEENGYDASFFYSIKNDEQLSAARQFITDGVDYLLISAAETTGWDAVLKDAQEAGIGVFLFDRMIDCDPELFEAAVVSDMAKEGETAVGWLLDQKLPEYNVIHIQGAMGSDAQLGRTGALDEQFEAGTMNKVVQQTATWDEAEAKKIVESVINSGDPFNVIYAENDGMAKGAVAALDEAGIGVFLFDRMIDCSPDLYTAAVVSDMRNEGVTAVAWLESLGLEEYNILHIQGQLGSAAQIGRSEPLQEKCEADEKWTMVREGTGGDSWDPNEARKIAEAAINAGEKFNIVYAENDGMAQGVVAALDANGITHGVNGDVIVMGFDCNKWALRELLAGNWNYDGQCSPFQASLIDGMIKTLKAGGEIEGLNDLKQIINDEKGFDARTITEEDIATYGLGE